ncbi:hypothetical protein C9374_005323 [Naegleria lovaniensis]|uniref:non-specific serine/threonine protein kinase n=1 Tax=Naegleria lovaniensis TaxID=51637 RepID=A0AA88KKA3_NAELO|nr:uncharacterized protein C9374_005323 [Naegleria lovaniensis]KAG2382743.1 hypothetical protein C9374_005323 [Naegleria lovaniensis]
MSQNYSWNDREYVLQRVQQDGLSLQLASQELRNDPEIVLEAMNQNEVAFEYASEELKINAEWLLKICNENNRLKKYIQEEVFGTIEKAKQGIARNVKIFLLLTPSLQKEPEIINSIFQEGPKQFSFASNFDEIIEYYSNNFISDQNTFDFYLYSNIQPTPSRTVFSIFTSTNYPKEMVIEFALMKLFHKFITSHHINLNSFIVAHEKIQHTTDYYLFSDTIHNFLDHLWNTLKSTHYKQLQKVVNNIVQDFPIEKLLESCFGFIVKFLNDWKQMKDFPRLTSIQQLTTQNLSKHGMELDRIRRCCQIAKSQPQFKTIHFISLLGMGAQGAVLRCLHKNHGMIACKFSFEPTNDPNRLNEQFKVLKDPRVKGHVIDCIECNTIEWNDLHYPYIIMEMGRGTLKEEIYSIHSNPILKYYKKESKSKFIEKQELIWILNCFIDILKAVTVLHGMNILYRDLKPENVILTQYGKPKLLFTSTIQNVQFWEEVDLNVGTYLYMAPETLSNDLSYIENNITVSKFCDVFSLGCLFMRMLTNCSLILDGTYLNSKEQDSYGSQYETTNTDDVNYFSEYGEYFYVAVATPHGESKLHQALYKELDKHIDPSWKVNDILGRCLMTMIQKDVETRRGCVRYIPILQAVKQSLEKDGDHNPDFSSLDLSLLKEYQPSFIEKMMKENRILKQLNMETGQILNRSNNGNFLLEDCQYVETIYQSTYGESMVWKVFHKKYGEIACKLMLNQGVTKNSVEEQFKLQQVEELKDYIVQCMEWGTIWLEKDQRKYEYVYLVMEMGQGTLEHEIITLHTKHWLSQSDINKCYIDRKYFIQVLSHFIRILNGMNVLHCKNLVHRDIKTSNVIISKDGKAKLIDFETMKSIQLLQTITSNVGTYPYMAPEVLSSPEKEWLTENTDVSRYCDVYSLGCVLMRLLTNCSLRIHPEYAGSKLGDNISNIPVFSNQYEGFCFNTLLTTPEGEQKLHRALYSEIDKHIDPSWKLNDVLGRCVITMIQQDTTGRRECAEYVKILEKVMYYLEHETEPVEFSQEELKILRHHEPSYIESLVCENSTLKNENERLRALLKQHGINPDE